MYRISEAGMTLGRKPPIMTGEQVARTSKWANRFVFAAVVQGLLALGLTAHLLYQATFGVPAVSKIVAGGSAGTWLTVGYLGYLILGLVGTAVTASIYRHLEYYQNKPFTGKTNLFGWAHLVLWNVGVTASTWLMMYAGYMGGKAAMAVSQGGLGYSGDKAGLVHSLVMQYYPPYIAALMAVALVGAFLGIVGYLLVWARPSKAPAPRPTEA